MQPTPNVNSTPLSENKCSQSKCKAVLAAGYQYKTCEKCQSLSRLGMQKKQKREKTDEGSHHSPATAPGSRGLEGKDGNVPVKFENRDAIIKQLKSVFKSTEHIFFHGCYNLPQDPLISEKAHVKATADDIWKVTENQALKGGHKTRYWCCQDKNRQQVTRPSQREGVKHRDTIGMHQYDCKSKLNGSCNSCCPNPRSEEGTYRIMIWLEHHVKHIPYYNVSLPPEAAALIQETLVWSCPHKVTRKVQITYPAITANQVHTAWTTMNTQQIPSVKALLDELGDDVAILDLLVIDGVEQIAWVMKKIASPLQGKVVEIGIDTTYNTNSHHLELYAVLGEYDNTGFLLSYCLLTTASLLKDRKCTKALQAWAAILHDLYSVVPRFAKHQLCWWHQCEALWRRLKGNLPTSVYNAQRARRKYPFIDGSVSGEICEQEEATAMSLTGEDPNSIKL
ncbi:hypothetical protein EDB83DRAFT_2507093 [Lactarius deliciosus]|nr:hypothetical protein EDB83DRAFT_2507093 [Lactarius deliciosus]